LDLIDIKLQKIQNTAARIVTRSKYSDHITPILKKLHWLPIKERIDFKVLCLSYACMNKTAPEYLQDIVPIYEPNRALRSSSKELFCRPNTKSTNKKRSGARAFTNSAPVLWNPLPKRIKASQTYNIFKKQLKTHLMST